MDENLLPTGIQEFRYVRDEGMYYVDKTAYIDRLLRDKRKHFFLSRPRRFGKSMFVDTLKEVLEGNEELFHGLAIHDKRDWSVQHPVIRLDYSGGLFLQQNAVSRITNDILAETETLAGLKFDEADPVIRLRKLIRTLYAQSRQRVALLVDEYDKPILDAIEHPETANANREQLRGIFGVLKQMESYVRLSFFTGVTRFSKTSLFSGVNNLNDITLSPEYSAICGYSETDLDNVFGVELGELDRDKIRLWYNGYNWLGEERVYNPHDILMLLEKRRFDVWWYDTGAPKFLVDVLKEQRVYSVEIGQDTVSEKLLSNFDVGSVDPLALLFQAGYLTIVETTVEGDEIQHKLDYPNLGVRRSLHRLLECAFLPGLDEKRQNTQLQALRRLLEKRDENGLEDHFRSLFAGIPHQWYDNSPISGYEAHCASVFYSHIVGAQLSIVAEDPSNKGRVDLVVKLENRVYVIEFKVSERADAEEAMEQMRAKNYAEKYRIQGVPIHLVAVEYSSEKRNIAVFRVEDV